MIRVVAMKKNRAKSKHTEANAGLRGAEKGPPREYEKPGKFHSQLVTWGIRYLWADGG